jgi:type II secretory ATPase GspE/PulE/Tfp pilus assembly ATPase PilB-like protein
LSGVLAQRLVESSARRARNRTSRRPTRSASSSASAKAVEQIFRPKGCPRCRNLGYAGRIGIYELLVPDDAMIEAISQGATLNQIRELGKQQGMKTLRQDGVDKVRAGITTLEEVYRATA